MCVVSVTVFEIMKFDSHETILCCQKNITIIEILKFLLLQCVLQIFHCQEMIYIVFFYIDRKNLHFVGGVEKNFNDLVQNAKKVHICM